MASVWFLSALRECVGARPTFAAFFFKGKLKRRGSLNSLFNAVLLTVSLTLGFNVYALESGKDAESPVASRLNNCPSIDFSDFFRAFSESTQLQKTFTRFPLEELMVINVEPEPKPIEKLLDRGQVDFPLIPNKSKRAAKGLGVRIEKKEQRTAKVVLFKEDTDYQVTYFFTKNGCWTLVRIENWSL